MCAVCLYLLYASECVASSLHYVGMRRTAKPIRVPLLLSSHREYKESDSESEERIRLCLTIASSAATTSTKWPQVSPPPRDEMAVGYREGGSEEEQSSTSRKSLKFMEQFLRRLLDDFPMDCNDGDLIPEDAEDDPVMLTSKYGSFWLIV
jgi:hypothetical protein